MDNAAPPRRLSTGNAEPIGSTRSWLELFAGLALAFAWMAACAMIPLLVFAAPRRQR